MSFKGLDRKEEWRREGRWGGERREERGRGEKTEEKRGEERGEIVSTQINDKIVTYSFSNYTDSV